MPSSTHRTPRQLAIAQKQTRYLGTPCRYGHSGERWVSSKTCVTCATKRMQQLDRKDYFKARYQAQKAAKSTRKQGLTQESV
jgi:hypothetical protein